MKAIAIFVIRFLTFTHTLTAVSIVGGESMDRELMDPSFDTKTENITAIAGETAELRCIAENKRGYGLIWLNPRKTLISKDESRYIDDSRISVERPNIRYWNIIIREVRFNDSGEYMCQINTKPVLIKRINLFVRVAPEIIDYGETNFVLPEGETVDLTCNATGVPIPVVTWYKQFKPIKDYTDGYFAGGRILPGETLRLKNVSRFCGGRYECIAENGVPPNATKVFHITVEFPPEVSLTNKRLGQSVGRETLLECRVAASPHANIYWTRERQDLPLHKTNKYVTNVYNDGEHEKTLSLNIIDITKEDFGSYTCHASNRLGQDSETMFLYENIKVTEPTVTTPPYRTHQPVRPVSPPRDSSFVNTPHYHSGNDQPGQYSESVYYNYNSKNSSPEQLVAHARMLMGMLLIWILKQIQTLQNHFFEIK